MTEQPKPREVFIQGITTDGRTFRPSDWAERLAGAMSCFRPGGTRSGRDAYLGYSPYCVPRVIDGIRRDRQRGAEVRRTDGLGVRP